MSEDNDWGTKFFYFHLDHLKEYRALGAASLVLSRIKKVSVDVGKRNHTSRFGPNEIYVVEKNQYVELARELHVTHTDTKLVQSSHDKDIKFKYNGEVRITYIGVTDNYRPLDIEIDLTKLEALQLARSLIAAAEKIEQSEQQLEA